MPPVKGLTLTLMAMAAFLISGCGYHALGTVRGGTDAGGGTIEVSIFANRSYRPNIEALLTDTIVDELVSRQGKRVVESGGELHLSGAVLSYGTTAVSYTAADAVKEYRATITAEMTLRRNDTGRVVWKGTLAATQDYPANDDLVLQQNSEDAAIRVICRKLAREAYLHHVEDF
ncbi:MAG: molecular chaperone [Desulfuromonadales bacterium]|nr:MAG: molecular chaperone [Desulfuromonadales bacterium]